MLDEFVPIVVRGPAESANVLHGDTMLPGQKKTAVLFKTCINRNPGGIYCAFRSYPPLDTFFFFHFSPVLMQFSPNPLPPTSILHKIHTTVEIF